MAVMARDEKLLIGGEWADASDRFEVTNPATGETVGSVPNAAKGDVEAAIDAASAALPAWRETAPTERSRILRRAAELLLERADAIGELMTREQGKPLAEAKGGVAYAAGFFSWFSGEAERIYGQTIPAPNPDKRLIVLRQGVGVTAAITPWNFPAAMLTRKLGPALAAGCTAVIKPASATPLTAVEVCRALVDAGVPEGVVNLITSRSSGMVSETLFSDRRVRKISFTGSTEVGKSLIRQASEQVKRLSLELGGHAPYIIFDDADLDHATDQLMATKFRNAGQTCICANRIYVQEAVHDEVVRLLTEKTKALVVGNGLRSGVTVGPLIDAGGVEKAGEHVADAISKGAKLLFGGRHLTDGEYGSGTFYEPTVLDGVTPEMLISSEETFGPVAGVTTFTTEDEAIELANDTNYGLASYFSTRDYARLLRVAERLEYGIVGANDGGPSNPAAPFGGVKESGWGREGGDFGIDEYLDVKYISIGGMRT